MTLVVELTLELAVVVRSNVRTALGRNGSYSLSEEPRAEFVIEDISASLLYQRVGDSCTERGGDVYRIV